MEKPPLQVRAEKAAKAFRESRRPAVVVEFAGLPKAGKTSTMNAVYSFLRRCGFRCEVVVERASVCPIRDKKHFNFNVWTACTSIAALLDKTQEPPREDDPDILFLDRGTFDALCWFSLLEHLARVRPADRQKVTEFLLIDDWTTRVTGVIAMTASPKDAMSREHGPLPVSGVGGSIMNPAVLRQMDEVIKRKATELRDRFNIFSVNTSSGSFKDDPPKTAEAVAKKILRWVEAASEENILSAPRSEVGTSLDADFVLSPLEASRLLDVIESKGDFRPRRRVEKDDTRIQPLPIVVVRNKSGDILRLVRKERDRRSRLHKSQTVWAGGHVRREDGFNGSAILFGAIRELQEELRLYVEPESLNLIGAVFIATGEKTRKHLAFVYEWRALSDDVQVALCNAEFLEKTGVSLGRGAFLPPDEIARESEGLEEWSAAIMNNLLTSREAARS